MTGTTEDRIRASGTIIGCAFCEHGYGNSYLQTTDDLYVYAGQHYIITRYHTDKPYTRVFQISAQAAKRWLQDHPQDE